MPLKATGTELFTLAFRYIAMALSYPYGHATTTLILVAILSPACLISETLQGHYRDIIGTL
jgi:hypothetical protein